MGGGFEDSDFLKKTYMKRADLVRAKENELGSILIPFRLDSLLAGSGKAKLKVEMGDIVTIYSLNDIFGQTDETVFISGHVKNPGEYRLHNDLKIKDLLFLAGGF